MPEIKGEEKHTTGLQGAPAHGLGVTPDGKVLFSTSKVYSTMYAYSLPNLEPLGHVHVGQHPEWVTFSPDGRYVYVAAAGDNSTHGRGHENAESRCKHSSWAGSEAQRDRDLAAVEGAVRKRQPAAFLRIV